MLKINYKKIITSYFFLGSLLTLALLWPMLAAPYFSHHDDVQVIRLDQMDKCIKDFQIPCRWVPNLGMEYGYPLFNYYAPLPYYFGEIINLITRDLLFSAKLMFATAFFGSFVFMFLLARKLWGDLGGLVSAVFYSYAPYHSVDLYVRGAMGELWALMFFPAIFWSVMRLYERVNVRRGLVLAVTIAGLIISHNISALIFLPLLLTTVFYLWVTKRNINFLKYFSIFFILGIILSSFYLLPVIFEKDLVHVDTTTFGYFSYTEHFKGLSKLILDHSWGWGASIREMPGGEKDGMSFQIGWIHLAGFLLSLVSLLWLRRSDKQKSLLIIFFAVYTAVSIFMVHPRSLSVWQLLESLKYLQFPWRFLMLIIFFISLTTGSTFLVEKLKYKKYLAILLIGLVVIVNFSYFKPEKFLATSSQDYLTGDNYVRQLKRSIFDYLPIYADAPPAEIALTPYQILSGESQINNFQHGSNWYKFSTETKALTTIRLSSYYFPNWQVKIDGRDVKINYQNELGLITFAIDPGNHQIEVKLEDTPIRQFGNVLTLISLIFVLVLLGLQFKRSRKVLIYLISGLHR